MKIFIPTPLRVYADKQDAVLVQAETVGEALNALTSQHPDLKKHLYSDEGKLRAFVNVYLNDEDVRYLPEKRSDISNRSRLALDHPLHRRRDCASSDTRFAPVGAGIC